MTTSYRDPEESKSQIKTFARKVLRRVHALGARTQTIDDVESELWVAWCIACDRFDPSVGCSFKTFLYKGMRFHINRWIQKSFERLHDETIAASLEHEIGEEGGRMSLGDVIADTNSRHDEEYQREDCFAYALSRASDRSKQFLEFLKNHPPELIERMKDLEAKSQYAKSQGISYAMPHRLTSSMIFDFMGASRTERKAIMDEVAQIGRLISNQD